MQSRNRAYATVYEIDLLNPVSTNHTNTSTSTGTNKHIHQSPGPHPPINLSKSKTISLPWTSAKKWQKKRDIPSSASISSTGGASGSECSGSSNASGFVISACCPTLSFPSQPLLSFIVARYFSPSVSGIRYLCIALCVLRVCRLGEVVRVTWRVRGVFSRRGGEWMDGMEWMVGEYNNRMRFERVRICYEEALSWTDHSERNGSRCVEAHNKMWWWAMVLWIGPTVQQTESTLLPKLYITKHKIPKSKNWPFLNTIYYIKIIETY